MEERREEVVLDEMTTPGGPLELVAYRAKGTAWVGIREKGPSAKGAIGLHSGSVEHFIQASAWIAPGWGVTFGGVAPEIERVEVRNERGEIFAGRVFPLPPPLEEEYRAAWGVATCDEECTLIGYDQQGHLVEQTMIRPTRRDLSPSETLELLRTHCDNGLRYCTWALKRIPSIPEQAEGVVALEHTRHQLAQVLAFIEGADEERTALSAVDSIVRRYDAIVEAEGWQPPFATGGSTPS